MDEMYDSCLDEMEDLQNLAGLFEKAGAKSQRPERQTQIHHTGMGKPIAAKKAVKMPMKSAMKTPAKGVTAVKRTMSDAGRQAIGDATRRRWAAKKKEEAKNGKA